MKRPLIAVVSIDLLFILLLILSASTPGLGSLAVYYLAFILPTVVGLVAIKPLSPVTEEPTPTLLSRRLSPALPLIFPAVAITALVAFLTQLLLGDAAPVTVIAEDNVLIAILIHAILPAVLEELLFRYIPLRLLAGYSRRFAVILSAVFFAFIHHSLAAIPYALVAGLAFAVMDLMADSLIPSVLAHLVNNLISLLAILYADVPALAPILYSALAVLAVLSVSVIIYKRKKYAEAMKGVLDPGEGYSGGLYPLLLLGLCLIIAVCEL